MPRLPIDYSKSIIYKICCNDVNVKEIYIGHTTDLIRRRQQHKSNINNEKSKEYNQYKYQFIRDNGGFNNWSLVPVEEFPCENVNQAKIRERYWIETLQAELNKALPSRSKEEYRENNKEKLNEKDRKYRQNNKDKIAEYKKQWYENNKEIIAEKNKEYHEENKDKIAEYHKDYRESNKEKIAEKRKVKFTCDCGTICRINDKARHFKTKKHQDYLTTIVDTTNESSS